MTTKEAVKDVMKERRLTQNDLRDMLGYAHQSGVSTVLNGDMRVGTLLRFMDALDCEIVLRDKSKYHKEWIIDQP